MLICPVCEKELVEDGDAVRCGTCGAAYPVSGGIYVFESSPPEEGESYREECFEVAHGRAKNLFWVTKRNDAILQLFRKHVSPDGRAIEIGCGTGLIQELLIKNGFQVEGGDIHLTALKMLRERMEGAYYVIDVKRLPFRDEFDAVGMFDVLEHIDDDEAALTNVHRALKPGGVLILTVPAKKKLWSPFDDVLCHKRRYEMEPLKALLLKNSFEILRISHLFFFLYPMVYLNRVFVQRNKTSAGVEKEYCDKALKLHPALNVLFGMISGVEVLMFRYMNFPVGSSIIAVARKK